MDTNLLLAEIKLKGLSMKEFLTKIKMPKSTWSKRIRGLSEFSRPEIKAIIETLKLDNIKAMQIFFDSKVA